MRYNIIFAPEADEELLGLRANTRSEVLDSLEKHLRHNPKKTSRSRIKRLRGLSRPQYRLRVGDAIRVFYDVTEESVLILAIIDKEEATDWLNEHGEPDEESPAV